MHNCKRTKEALLDLAFEELSSEQSARVKSDLNQCAACRAEYASIAETLGAVDQAFELATPREQYWSQYENQLAQRLNQSVQQSTINTETSFLHKVKKFFLFPVRVPASVAAIFVLVFVLTTVLAVRSQSTSVQAPLVQRVVETRNVEVPVFKDREVTRVVYVERGSQRSRAKKTRPESNFASGAPASLAGFRPIDEVKLTVIKGSESNEK